MRRGKNIQIDQKEKGQVARIESSVKRNRFYFNANLENFRRTAAYIHRLINDFLPVRGEADLEVFKTVPVTALCKI